MSIAPQTSIISVIIPTLNEADNLPQTLAPLRNEPGLEIIVADGGSSDNTTSIAKTLGALVIQATGGRADQQNQGAAATSGDILLFLHGDTILPAGFGPAVRSCLARPAVVAGSFRLAIAGPGRGLRLIERLANWRARQLQLPYGDQALFLRRETFEQLGGFPAQAIMEDFELARRLKRMGRIELLELAASTSARRWQRLGVARTTLLNQAIIIAYLLGCSPCSLASWYRSSSRARR